PPPIRPSPSGCGGGYPSVRCRTRATWSARKRQEHAHAPGGVEAIRGLPIPDGPDPWAQLVVAEHPKSQVAVERRVPGDVAEGRERQRRHARLRAPPEDPLHESPPHTQSLMTRVDAHLLDMGVPIDGIDQHVADRAAGIVDCDPAAPMLGGGGE